MPKPFAFEIPEFHAGLVTGRSALLVPPDGALDSSNVDYSWGTLGGLYGFGDSVATGITANTQFIHHVDGVGWTTSLYKNFACLDGALFVGGALTGISYYTNNTSGAAAQPLISAGANWTGKVMQVTTNTITSITPNVAQARSYRITRAIQIDSLNAMWESNPSAAVSSANSSGCTLNFTAAGTNATGVTYTTRVYATAVGTTTGPFYYIGSANSTATTYLDSATTFPDPLIMLNWASGGNPSSALYKFDHSASPSIYVLADALMGVAAVPAGFTGAAYGSARAGILFGAYYATLYWSANGYPWYWPTLNAEELDDIIEAIVVDRAVAYVFTRSSIYVISGSDDTALTINKTRATHGCMVEAGPTCKRTPYGILYRAPEGIALFDGDTSHLISEGLLPTGFDSTWSRSFAAYKDDCYILMGNTSGYLVNLSAWPKASITKVPNPTDITAMAMVQPHASGGLDDHGLYVCDNSDHKIKPWSPRQGGHNATKGAWSHTTGAITGAITGGSLAKPKRFRRFWAKQTGSVTYTLSCYDNTDTLIGAIASTGSCWLPATFTGHAMTVNIASSDGTVRQTGFRIEGDIYA